MNIVLRELRANLKSLIIWCLCQIALIYMGMVEYSGFAKMSGSVNEMMASLPPALQSVFGIGVLDLTKLSGYFGVFFLYFVLLGTIHAATLGAVILSKEERDKTADFLLVKPVKRSKIITSKIIAGFINLLLFNMTTFIGSIIFMNQYNKENMIDILIPMMIGLGILQILFFSIGIGMSTLTKSTKKATSITTGFLLGTFILSVVIDMVSKLDNLKYFTPFKYFEGKTIVMQKELDPTYILISAGIILFFLVITYVRYSKKDINT